MESAVSTLGGSAPSAPAPFTLHSISAERRAVFDLPELKVQLTKRAQEEPETSAPSGKFSTEDLDGVETDEENDLQKNPQEEELDVDWQTDGTVCRAPGRKIDESESATPATSSSSPRSDEQVRHKTQNHSAHPTRSCIEYRQYGQCHYEDRCKFSHDLSPEEEARLKAKWTYVSLENAPKGTDKAQAMAFLRDLRERKEKETIEKLQQDAMDVDEETGAKKFVFKKPEKREEPDGGPKNECVVGMAKKPKKNAKRSFLSMEMGDMD